MGKCCGGGSSPQKSNREGNNRRCVTVSHDEEVCHGTGERRRDLIDQLKIFLDDFDDRPCQSTPPQDGADALRPLGQYPGYMKKHCQSWMPSNPRPPLITSVQTHEVRPTDDYENKKHLNNEYITYVDARSKPPPMSCDCAKRNGLQDQCPRFECTPPTPQCLAVNPGPCCPPSLGLTGREHTTNTTRAYDTQEQAYDSKQQGYNTQPQEYNSQAPGLKMFCICKASPSNMPSGKKYICCPAPLR